MNCDFEDQFATSYCIATYVLCAVAVFFILLSTALLACCCGLCCKAYRFKRLRCNSEVIHCLCCICELKDIQADVENGTVAQEPPAVGDLPQDTSTEYEPVRHHTVAHGSLGNRRPEPLPRPLSPTMRPHSTHISDTDDNDEDGSKPRTRSVENNYIEFVQDANPDTTEGSVSLQVSPPPGLRQSSTLQKRVTKEEVQVFGSGYRRRATVSEDDEVPLLGDTANKGGYKSTEKVLPKSARTLPSQARAGSKFAHKQASAFYQRPREAHDDGGGCVSPPSSDAASSDDTVSSNPVAVREVSRSLPHTFK